MYKILCNCGIEYNTKNKKKHLRNKIHQNYLKEIKAINDSLNEDKKEYDFIYNNI